MKFLILLDQHQGGVSTPESVEDIARRSKQWVQENQRNNRIESAYYFVEGGGFIIVNADSTEELFDFIHSNPAPLLRPEVRMLMDFESTLDRHTPHHLRHAEAAFGRVAGGQAGS